MNPILVRLQNRSYSIHIGVPLNGLGLAVKKSLPAVESALIVTHPFLQKKYGSRLISILKKYGIKASAALMEEGERKKNIQTVQKLYQACVQAGLDRTSCIIALGGGVVGDTAGYAAATYLRGISLVQVPTTLLAMVDSSIGGKVGIDLEESKNSVGAFHQPKIVWIDPETLKTLPKKEWVNGFAEIVKYGIIKDRKLFDLLEKETNYDSHLNSMIWRCAKIKAEVVSKDEKETQGLREILNFGHTLGHTIETVTRYSVYKHGEAIAIGMCAAGKIAQGATAWDQDDQARMERLLQRIGLPIRLRQTLPSSQILSALYRDKKARHRSLRFVLPVKIGQVTVQSVPENIALEALAYVQA